MDEAAPRSLVNLTGIFQWNYGSESLRRMSSGENGKRGSEGHVETQQRNNVTNVTAAEDDGESLSFPSFFNIEMTKLLFADGILRKENTDSLSKRESFRVMVEQARMSRVL